MALIDVTNIPPKEWPAADYAITWEQGIGWVRSTVAGAKKRRLYQEGRTLQRATKHARVISTNKSNRAAILKVNRKVLEARKSKGETRE